MVPVGEKMLDQLTEATELHIEQYEAPAYNLRYYISHPFQY